MKKLNIEDFKDLQQPTTITLLDNEGNKLMIQIFEEEIYIDTNENSWCVVDDAKKELEQAINPDSKIRKRIKSHIKYFLISLSKLF